ncbi:hypothetical protein Desaci_1235 [Desulfosporosinus acidiphilus SJ4]|uniref:Uncharacterized protein n=1 Tax=Desulfosporosinus acidiphilus (strain DSM 22704 / JCM 16185 / SJ4) TaxID=646529 RepID=I4D391_DESAJ|nr:hypothetical protein [Desulfosporosinus acidiphilus]AFM40265.1 hypothetical protein Desaci_1235 [Desulfosporosinus acidiphilus SJ4]
MTNTKTIIGYNLFSYPTLVVIALVLFGLSIFLYKQINLEHGKDKSIVFIHLNDGELKSNDWIFAKLPNWLRWILSLPVAIFVFLVIQYLLSFTIHNILGWTYQNEVIRSVVMMASVISFIACFFYCLPKYKAAFTVASSILLSIYFLLYAVLGIINGFVGDIAYGVSVIVCICIVVGILLSKDSMDIIV